MARFPAQTSLHTRAGEPGDNARGTARESDLGIRHARFVAGDVGVFVVVLALAVLVTRHPAPRPSDVGVSLAEWSP